MLRERFAEMFGKPLGVLLCDVQQFLGSWEFGGQFQLRKDDDSRLRKVAANCDYALDAVRSRHLQVHQRDIRPTLFKIP
jgi:hypothetical protein